VRSHPRYDGDDERWQGRRRCAHAGRSRCAHAGRSRCAHAGRSRCAHVDAHHYPQDHSDEGGGPADVSPRAARNDDTQRA